ncbi:mitochondrial carrier protein-like protein [Novymonas esmeraldas]|uniref:Mitochondrial carrier protein-like protein n=1 Tax=Novymonas esmeraldas TaxID=1808958 RepID=A0AAW0ERZ8_9TRYP
MGRGDEEGPQAASRSTSSSGVAVTEVQEVPGAASSSPPVARASPEAATSADVEDDEVSIAKSLHLRRDWYSSLATFVAGGVAGAASRTLTAPLDRIKLIVQEGHLVQAPSPPSAAPGGSSAAATTVRSAARVRRAHPGLLEVARMIKADGGWRAFWRGNTINCFKAGPEFAIVFSIRRYLSSLYEDCVERERSRKKLSAARWKERDDRSMAISRREQEERESMMVEPGASAALLRVPGDMEDMDGVGDSEAWQRERAISVEASIFTPPFNRLGCISNVPQLAVNCTIGAIAGLGAQGLLYPMEVVKTRVVVSRSSEYQGGVAEIVRVAYRRGGLMEFYRGFTPNMVGIVVYRGLEMGLYSSAQQSIMVYRMQVRKMNRHEASLGSAEVGAVGMFSSIVAQTVSYPLNVIRTRLQTQGTNGRAKKYTGMVDCMVKMIRNKGVTSLFSGLTANYLKAVPASACTFVVFERVQRMLLEDG